MEITRKQWIIAGGSLFVAVLIVVSVTQRISPRRAVAPQPAVSEPVLEESNATTTPVVSKVTASNATRPDPELPRIVKDDTIVSWNFPGAYVNNPELVAKANAEISRFSILLETATSSKMNLLVSIANNYDLLGDGKNEYDYLSRAIGVGGETTGLPWHNLGVLMEKLGALQTARVAYQKATIVQPQLKQWHFAYLEFLTTRMKDTVTDIEKAFAAAFKSLGQDPEILLLQTEWKKS